MKKYFNFILAVSIIISIMACSKSDSATPADVKSIFVGNWAGSQQINGAPNNPYKFSLQINADNTVLNIDSSFNNTIFQGTYTYNNDSIKVAYNNGTKWNFKFFNNYTIGSGLVFGVNGAAGTISMTKK